MQLLKKTIKYRVTDNVCEVMLAAHITRAHLAAMRASNPSYLTQSERYVPAYNVLDVGPEFDLQSEHQLLQRGLKATGPGRAELLPALEALVQREVIDGWTVDQLRERWPAGTVYLHGSAHVQSSSIVHSTSYMRSKTRDATSVVATYLPRAGAAEKVTRVVVVRKLGRLPAPPPAPDDGPSGSAMDLPSEVAEPLRFALVDVYEPGATLDDIDGDLGVIWRATKGRFSSQSVALDLKDLYFSVAKATHSDQLCFMMPLVSSDARRL